MTGRQPPGLPPAASSNLFGDHAKHALPITRFMTPATQTALAPPAGMGRTADALTAAPVHVRNAVRARTPPPCRVRHRKSHDHNRTRPRDGCTPRHARRMATQLDGQKSADAGSVPTAAVNEHPRRKNYALIPDPHSAGVDMDRPHHHIRSTVSDATPEIWYRDPLAAHLADASAVEPLRILSTAWLALRHAGRFHAHLTAPP